MTSYIHFEVNKGRATAAFEVERDVLSGKETACVALAFCSPEDQFSRKKGRLIADGRFNAGKIFCEVGIDPENKRVKSQVMDWLRAHLPTHKLVPWWVNPENKHTQKG